MLISTSEEGRANPEAQEPKILVEISGYWAKLY
jgi:hypothetical protein